MVKIKNEISNKIVTVPNYSWNGKFRIKGEGIC